MKLPGSGKRMFLGQEPEPEPGRRRLRVALPARPAVVDEGVELEAVWYPHRDAASLVLNERPILKGQQ